MLLLRLLCVCVTSLYWEGGDKLNEREGKDLCARSSGRAPLIGFRYATRLQNAVSRIKSCEICFCLVANGNVI